MVKIDRDRYETAVVPSTTDLNFSTESRQKACALSLQELGEGSNDEKVAAYESLLLECKDAIQGCRLLIGCRATVPRPDAR